jgi:cytochrome c biogenesis protein CcmG/thiol:disulfide interchange protein DsbE
MRATFAALGACTLAVAALATGCGSQQSQVSVPTPSQARAALAGSPAPLAALHRQASQLLAGGTTAFDARLASLHGHPVVVNAWASWCVPCKQEFPLLQHAAVVHGKRVAFLGVDANDGASDARRFLRSHYVAYPSYADPDEQIAHAIGVRTGIPTTVIYDGDGKSAFVHQGPYRDEAALLADIRRYAGRS